MKETLILIAAIALAGCTENQKRARVSAQYPDCELSSIPHQTDEFLIRKADGSVWFVFCGNPLSSKVTSESKAFGVAPR